MTSFILLLNDMFKVKKKNVWVKLNSESKSDSKFDINSVLDLDSASASDSDSESKSDFSSVLMNLDICIFFIVHLDSSK